MIVIDDQLLLAVLSDTASAAMTASVANGELFTTGSWYYRLGRAIVAGSGTGSLSGRVKALEDSARQRVTAPLEDLPDKIGLLSLRVVVPVMQALTVTRPSNFFNPEALGAALLLDASLVVAVDAPLLRSGAAHLTVGYRLVD